MPLTRYGYRNALNGLFELPTDNARRLLPSHLEPAELHHGTSILSVACFDFTESEVGAYGEVVMAVLVSPLVKPGERLPKAALYPYLVGTTTRAAREHAIERWHLPHWMEDVEMAFEPSPGALRARVGLGGQPVLDLTLTEHAWERVSHPYQCFMRDGSGAYLAHMTFDGEQSEHENETGKLLLHDHPFHQGLAVDDVYDVPFREVWNRAGVQTFDPLVTLDLA